jgi:hypothetical protein|tara:strand:- start:23919 stop:24083 length:165 start_codon:yes stop_codon:yes gene_type:complete
MYMDKPLKVRIRGGRGWVPSAERGFGKQGNLFMIGVALHAKSEERYKKARQMAT